MKSLILAGLLVLTAPAVTQAANPFPNLKTEFETAVKVGDVECPGGVEGLWFDVIRGEKYYRIYVVPNLAAVGEYLVADNGDATLSRIYMGTVTQDGTFTVTREEPFDPKTHRGPCQDWLDRPSA